MTTVSREEGAQSVVWDLQAVGPELSPQNLHFKIQTLYFYTHTHGSEEIIGHPHSATWPVLGNAKTLSQKIR